MVQRHFEARTAHHAGRALADGRIRHLGFSFHDDYACFAEILDGSDLWTFCQIQYNYMDIENQAGTRGLRLAAEKGLAVVIMEPLMGGRLADPPPDIRETIAGDPAHRSPAQLAFEWLWDHPEVSVVLSGMSTMSQVVENLRFADSARPGKLGPADQALIARIREQYKARTAIPCTQCGYCMPCPNDVNIPVNFELFNYAHAYDDLGSARSATIRAQGRRARRRLHRVRHVRRLMSATHSNFRLDAKGVGVAGKLEHFAQPAS